MLAGHGHQGRTNQLTNTGLLSYNDLAALLREVTRRTITHRHPSPPETVQALADGGMDSQQELTGRAPLPSAELVRRILG